MQSNAQSWTPYNGLWCCPVSHGTTNGHQHVCGVTVPRAVDLSCAPLFGPNWAQSRRSKCRLVAPNERTATPSEPLSGRTHSGRTLRAVALVSCQRRCRSLMSSHDTSLTPSCWQFTTAAAVAHTKDHQPLVRARLTQSKNSSHPAVPVTVRASLRRLQETPG